MPIFSALVKRLFGARQPEDRTVDRVINQLEEEQDVLDRRLSALRAQVEAQTRWRREHPRD